MVTIRFKMFNRDVLVPMSKCLFDVFYKDDKIGKSVSHIVARFEDNGNTYMREFSKKRSQTLYAQLVLEELK